jgi:hypothetical protein
MLNAGEVGASFVIIDNASPVLKRLMEQLQALQTRFDALQTKMKEFAFPPGLLGEITKLDDALLSVGESAAKGAEGAATAFAGIDTSIATTMTAVARLKREMAGLGGSRTIGPGGISLPHTGSGTGRGGMHGGHFGSPGVPLPGGGHYSMPGGPVMAGAAALGYGMYLEGEFEDQASRMISPDK